MFKNIYLVLCYLALTGLTSCKEALPIEAPQDLTISEGFKNPFGFYDAKPTFSWVLPVSEHNKSQSAYRILVASSPDALPDNADLWDSEKQNSNQSTWVTYKGKALTSRQKVYWRVKYWNQDGEASNWSETNHFELGLLNNKDWKAQWIGVDTKKENVQGSQDNLIHRPQYLRKDFELSGDVTSARLYITAKGVFDVSINGEDVSNDVMPPGYTPYKKRIETITYNVSKLINSGKNAIGVEVASGWHSGRLGWMESFWSNTPSPKIICQLELTMKDGSKKMIISDESWKGTTKGPTRLSEIYDGETYDANLEFASWNTNGFDDKNWQAVDTASLTNEIRLEPKRHHTVKPKIEIASKAVTEKDGTLIFDLKQNMVGVPRLKVPMKKGETLKIRFAEMLAPDGSFYTKNYRSAQSTNYYTAAADGIIEWAPKFTFHGFRYVELSGYDATKTPTKDWVTGVVQYSDFEQNGTFTSSHEKLNQLQSNIVWGLRGNFFDIPTDCPQRDERMGWTGDAQVFGPTSMFNADVYGFWASWLQSVRESQYDNGGIPWVVPDVLNNDKVSAGWGDVCTIIPWKIYFRTGDKRILEDNYEMMKAWVAYHKSKSKQFISKMGFFADWLQPYPENGDNKGDTALNVIGTAFFARSAKLTAQTAKTLGREDDYNTYMALYREVAKAFDAKFFDAEGNIVKVPETQTSYLLALAFDLLPEAKRKHAHKNLLQKIKDANNHLRTGFLGTPLLSKVLDGMGDTDLMYTLLFNETYPSWFYSINQGATTIWERWNSYSKAEGFNPQNMNSLNHYAYGAIGEWMYERIAGIAPLEAGYKKIQIAPQVQQPLNSASAALNTPYGKVSSAWEIKEGAFSLTTTIPPNTTAKIIMPGKVNAVEESSTIKTVKAETGDVELLVQPGTYTFTSQL